MNDKKENSENGGCLVGVFFIAAVVLIVLQGVSYLFNGDKAALWPGLGAIVCFVLGHAFKRADKIIGLLNDNHRD